MPISIPRKFHAGRAIASPLLVIFLSAVMCDGCGNKGGENGDRSVSEPRGPGTGRTPGTTGTGQTTGTTGTGTNQTTGTTATAQFSCAAHLAKEPTALQSYYEDGFSHFGAFLLYYQDLIAKNGMPKAKDELSKFMILIGRPDLYDVANPRSKYFGYKLDEAIKKADDDLKDPDLKKYWQDWCENPGNFLSWMIIPSTAGLTPQKDKPLSLIRDISNKNLTLSFFDDGVIFFKWISGVGETVGTVYSGKTPDAKAWYSK